MDEVECLGDVEQPVRSERGGIGLTLAARARVDRSLRLPPAEILHHDERMPLELADVDDLDDMGMAELDQRANLARESIEKSAPRSLVGRDREFEHDVGFEMMIGGEVDLPHAPLADPTEDLVPPIRDLPADPVVIVGSHDVEPLNESVTNASMK